MSSYYGVFSAKQLQHYFDSKKENHRYACIYSTADEQYAILVTCVVSVPSGEDADAAMKASLLWDDMVNVGPVGKWLGNTNTFFPQPIAVPIEKIERLLNVDTWPLTREHYEDAIDCAKRIIDGLNAPNEAPSATFGR